MEKMKPPFPDKLIPTIKADMMSYHKHQYSFDEFCERNMNGRTYGAALMFLLEQTLSEYKEQHD